MVIVFGTAYGGAWTGLVGALILMGRRGAAGAATSGDVWMAYPLNPAPGEAWVPVAWLVLGTVGALVQLSWTGRGKARGARRSGRRERRPDGARARVARPCCRLTALSPVGTLYF